jgi:iron(III) transport system ATP-binding protein
MRDGRVVQHAPPVELYTAPADPGVARFVGDAVVLDARLHDGVATCVLGDLVVETADGAVGDGPVQVMVRPEQILLCGAASSQEGVPARVEESSYFGRDASITLVLADGTRVTARCAGDSPPHPGDDVKLTVGGRARVYRDA